MSTEKKTDKTEAKMFRFPSFRKEPPMRVSDDEVSFRKRPIVNPETAISTIQDAIDLTGKSKLDVLAGSGLAGKTTLGRWIGERSHIAGHQPYLAAIDPHTRDLGSFFNDVHEPESFEPAKVFEWLESFVDFIREERNTAVIDLGGGDTTLMRMIETFPDFVQMMEDAGVSPVLLYVLTPRLSDLGFLESLQDAGFQPKATALILNEGKVDPLGKGEAFARTMQHGAFRTAVDRGAVVIRMPRLIPAKEVEDRRITFAQARDRISPPGRNVVPLGAFDQRRVAHWLTAMEAAFAPVASWLP